MTLGEFQTEIQARLGDTSNGFWTATNQIDWINEAIRETARLGRCYERVTSFASFNGVQEYRVPTDYMETKAISYISGSIEYPLDYMDIRDARAAFTPSTSATIPYIFSIWQHVRSHQRLWIFPKPNTTWTNVRSPGAPTVAVSGTSGITGTSLRYRVTYYNNFGETDGGTVSSTVSPSAQQVDVSAIPTTTNTNVVGRNVYRLQSSGSVYFFLTQIADRSTTTTYTDTTNDNDLGPELVPENTANNIRLYYYAIPATALSASGDTPEIPTPDYDEAVIAFVLSKAMERSGEYNIAQRYETEWRDAVAEIKGDETTKHRAHFPSVGKNSILISGRLGKRYNFTTPISSAGANQ